MCCRFHPGQETPVVPQTAQNTTAVTSTSSSLQQPRFNLYHALGAISILASAGAGAAVLCKVPNIRVSRLVTIP